MYKPGEVKEKEGEGGGERKEENLKDDGLRLRGLAWKEMKNLKFFILTFC